MKIVVVGLGSMGKRRIRLTQKMQPSFTLIGVDGRADRRKEAETLLGISTYPSIAEAKAAEQIDCAFVCTSPLSHAAIIHECLQNGWHIFTEINLVSDGYAENMALAKAQGKVLFLSSTNLYNNDVRRIQKAVAAGKSWNYVYHVGQYLPDWHPWESYKDFFIGQSRTNGCREILAIELPWLVKTFGAIADCTAMKDRNTTLDIDFYDNYMLSLRHENGNKGLFVVDVVTPVAVHSFEAFTERGYISWDGTPENLKIFDAETRALQQVHATDTVERADGYADFIIENDYENELAAFFDCVLHDAKAPYTFADGLDLLTRIDALEA